MQNQFGQGWNGKQTYIENGSWGPIAAKKMTEELQKMKNIEVCENVVTIRSKRHDADNEAFEALKNELM